MAGRLSSARASSGNFAVDHGVASADARPVAGVASMVGIDALLALQAIEDPLAKRRKLVRRGTQLIDTLEQMKTDLLTGRISESSLNQLMALVQQAREKSDPELDALVDEIELRARVELAKNGRFPA